MRDAIARLLHEALGARARSVQSADRVAAVLLPLVLAGAEKIRQGLTTIEELASVWQQDGGGF